jgi:hypothetical protein
MDPWSIERITLFGSDLPLGVLLLWLADPTTVTALVDLTSNLAISGQVWDGRSHCHRVT